MGRLLTQAPARLSPLRPRVAPPPKKAERFYSSPEWRGLVADIKRSRGAHCVRCGAGGRGVRIIADHIIERKDGGADLDERNVELLCIGCHNAKTARAKAARAAGAGV